MPSASAPSRNADSPWVFGLALVATLLGVVVIYWSTFASLISIWARSETFAHCFLIAPLSLFLIWRQRNELASAPRTVSLLGVAAMLGLSITWFVADLANVQVGQQFAAVLLLVAAVPAIIGLQATKLIAFPLGYLLFAVRFDGGLIPILMDFTAAFTVQALQLTGVPVLREGLYFSIPSGDFEVAEACSGIRYLIACLALGVLYSHITFRSLGKRIAFIGLCCIAPIIANGVRAYMIVVLAHLSGMRLAVGVDHLIYGWVFFGALVALLFWIGSRFQDAGDRPTAAPRPFSPRVVTAPAMGGAVALAIGAASVGPYLAHAAATTSAGTAVAFNLPVLDGAYEGPVAVVVSRLLPDTELSASGGYSNAEGFPVTLELARFDGEVQGEEMVGSLERALAASSWQVLDVATRTTRTMDRDVAIRETLLREGRRQRVVWSWYAIGDRTTANDWYAKMLEAWGLLTGGRTNAAVIAVSAEAAELPEARERLREFIERAYPDVHGCLTESSSEGRCTADRW